VIGWLGITGPPVLFGFGRVGVCFFIIESKAGTHDGFDLNLVLSDDRVQSGM
jgi:hypothetical protein